MGRDKIAVLIAGPTAGGKSALALDLARKRDALIVNCDAMQVYGVLNVLTARPGPGDLGAADHRLYGFVDPSVRFSAGAWVRQVKRLIQEEPNRNLIFAGGTGLYFEALTKGFAMVPEVPAALVSDVEAEVGELDRAGRRALLKAEDPVMAVRLEVPDRQRVVRAVAVMRATGRSLASFQDEAAGGLLTGYDREQIVLDPGRERVRERIARRFEAMIEGGAAAEAGALLGLGLDPSLPAMKAIGVREVGGWLSGGISRDEAVRRAVIASQQYAKRQRTWFRNRMADWDWRES